MTNDFLAFLKSLAPLDLGSAGDSVEEIERRAIYDTAAGILAEPESELVKAFPQARHFRLRRESAPELCDYISRKRRLASNATSRAKDVEKSRAYVKRWKADNPDKVKTQKKRWKADNPEKVKIQNKRWKAENPDKVKAQKSVYKKLSCDKNYHRPFVAIDSEGMNYSGHDRYGPVEKPENWSEDFIGPLFQVTYQCTALFCGGQKAGSAMIL